MAQLTACDNCRKTEPTSTGLPDWWQIEPPGESWYLINEPRPPFTLCSWQCVAEYASKRAATRAAARDGR
jgi:hypothetical protein